MPMTGVISGTVTPKDKTKSNPLARVKVRIFSKSVVSAVLPDYLLCFSLNEGFMI